MRTLLVLGGTRFIGKHLLSCLDTSLFKVYYFHRGVTAFSPNSNAVELYGDRTNEGDIRKLFNTQFDIIIDVSGEEYKMVELSVRYSKKSQPYYIYISSSSVYQPSKDIHIETESLNANSNSTYINIKILCEKLVQNSFEKYAIVRPSKVYGPYNHICRESYFYKRLINNEQIVLINDPILHFTFVIDLVEGILRLAKKEPIGIFNVAGKEPMRLSLFIEIMAKKMNISPLIIWDIDSDAPMTKLQTCVLSNMKMYEVCGWQPHYTIAEGMDFTLQYLRGE